jgi:hypothetical protein
LFGVHILMNFNRKFEICFATDTANAPVLSRKIRAI